MFAVAAKAGSAARKLTTWTGPDDGRLAWSPDSKSIAYTQGAELKLLEYSQARPAVVTLDGKVSYPAAKFDRGMREPIYSPTDKLAYLVEDDRNQYPAEVELTGNGVEAAVGSAGRGDGRGIRRPATRRCCYTNDNAPGGDLCAGRRRAAQADHA